MNLDYEFWRKKRQTKRWLGLNAGLWREVEGASGRKMKIKCG